MKVISTFSHMWRHSTRLSVPCARAPEGSGATFGDPALHPHGALIGTDNLVEWRHMWEKVEITFIKSRST